MHGLLAFPLGLITAALSCVGRAAIIYLAVQALSGHKITFGEALARGLKLWWPVFLVWLCVAILSGLGFFLLIIPGVFAVLRWSVAIPARVIEDARGLSSMQRSAELTQGHRMDILGLFIVMGLAVFLIECLLLVVFVHPVGSFLAVFASPVTRIAIAPLITFVTAPIFMVVGASLYYQLRSVREGVGTEALAEVFQ